MPSKKIQIVGIITKRNHKPHKKTIEELIRYLKKKKKEVLVDNNISEYFSGETGYNKEQLLARVDLVIVLGGDGTLLKTARRLTRKKTLVLAVNIGNLGFLSECQPDKLFETLNKVFAGKYVEDRRSVLRVTIYRGAKKIHTCLALNDAVINQGAFARLIEMDLEFDNLKVVKFRGDGMIVATPTGSTGHSLSAGGPIIHPYIEGLIVTPICPSSLSMRPIIIPDRKLLTVTVATQRRDEAAKIGLTLDGQDTMELHYGDKIKIRRSKRYLYLIRTRHRYYRRLRNKLNWGDL
ncbi:MAG: NAD(+)/NADH kinase [bacterium]|nr:NAD(+)/NADH kinase [bacterium]